MKLCTRKKNCSTFATELELSPLCKPHFTSSPRHFPCNYSLNPLNGDFILLSAAPGPARRGSVIGDFFISSRWQKPRCFYLKLLSLQYTKSTPTSWGHFNPVWGFMQLSVFSCGTLECGSIRLEIRWNFIALAGELRCGSGKRKTVRCVLVVTKCKNDPQVDAPTLVNFYY